MINMSRQRLLLSDVTGSVVENGGIIIIRNNDETNMASVLHVK